LFLTSDRRSHLYPLRFLEVLGLESLVMRVKSSFHPLPILRDSLRITDIFRIKRGAI
jgi:hypothetical protein